MSTYLSLHYHLIFGTKNRVPFIKDEWKLRLHQYLGGTVNSLNGVSQGVGGIADHVHLLVGLRATHCLADFVRDLKKKTSIWVHNEIKLPEFAWQEGYAAFTVGANSRSQVQGYIANQPIHHRKESFRDELKALMIRAEIEFEERFLD